MYRNKVTACIVVGLMIVIMLVGSACTSDTTTTSTTTTSVSPSATTTTTSSTTSTTTTTTTTTTQTTPTTMQPQTGGTLEIIASSVPVLAPIKTIFAAAGFYLIPVLETLIGQDENGKLAPNKLATSWEIGADGKSLTLYLRHGVTFHDGTDFNAEAVKYNIDVQLGFRAEVAAVTSVDVIDTYTVRLNLSSYSNTLLQQLSWVSGMMQSPTALQTHEPEWFNTHAVGCGPFKLISLDSPNSMVFEKYDGYWDAGKPYLDGIVYTFVIDPVTAEMSFRAGEGQVWDQMTATNLKSIEDLDVNINSCPRTIWVAIGDSANPDSPFSKLAVREAIDYAIDKVGVANAFGANTWEAPTQCASKTQVGYIPGFVGRPYDPEKAKQLVIEAGYPDGFQTTLTVRNNIDMNVVAIYQANLAAAGIDVEIVPADTGTYRSLLSKGWEGIILNGLGVSGSVAKVLQNDGPNSNYQVSALATDNTIDAMAAAIAADPASEVAANQDLTRAIFEDAVLVPWNIDSQSCAYGDSVHTDLDVVSLQWWNPGDTWLSQ